MEQVANLSNSSVGKECIYFGCYDKENNMTKLEKLLLVNKNNGVYNNKEYFEKLNNYLMNKKEIVNA